MRGNREEGRWAIRTQCIGVLGVNIKKKEVQVELRLAHGNKGAWGIVPSKVTLILPLLYLGFS